MDPLTSQISRVLQSFSNQNPFSDISEEDLLEEMQEFWQELSGLQTRVPKLESDELWTFPVPLIAEDGSCSLPNQLEKVPFDLRAVFDPADHERIARLKGLIRALKDKSEADWAGIYQFIEKKHWNRSLPADWPDRFLVKLAYDGKPSRAIFPVVEDFEKKSNNVRSFMKQKVILIEDMKEHIERGGAYYECDSLVQSELCFPVIEDGRAIGLIDLEGFQKNQFGPRDLAYTAVAAAFMAPLLKAASRALAS